MRIQVRISRRKPTRRTLETLYKTINVLINDEDSYYTKKQVEGMKRNES